MVGETGLRKPGTCYFEHDWKSAVLCEKGYVSICSETSGEVPEIKEKKQKPETKQHKFKRVTK